MAQLTFSTSNPLVSNIDRLWDFRDGGSAGYTWGAISYPRGIEFFDLNGDGLKDLVLCPNYYNYEPACPMIYSFNEGGEFNTFHTIDPPLSSAFATNGMFQLTWKGDSYLLVIDQGLELDPDGNGLYVGSKNWLFRYDAASDTLVDATDMLPDNEASFNHIARIGDLNNDGNPDVLFSRMGADGNDTTGGVWWSFEDSIRNRSDELPTQIAESENRITLNWGSPTQTTIGSIGYADFDGNGTADFISLSYNGIRDENSYDELPDVRIYFNGEASALSITSDYIATTHYFPNDTTSRPYGAMDCATGDVDHDGDTDLIVMWEGMGTTYLQALRNDGSRNFTDVTDQWLQEEAYRDSTGKDTDGNYRAGISRIQLTDVDADGYVDLLMRTYSVATSGLVNGLVDQSFLLRNTAGTGFTPYDFSSLSSGLSSLYNTTELTSSRGGFPYLADLTGDGVLDLTFVQAADTFTNQNGQYYSTFYQVVTLTGTGTDDSSAPTVASFSPTSGSSDAAATTNIVINFSEAVRLGTGAITLTTAGGAVAASWDVADNSTITVYDKTISINPATNLLAGTTYSLSIATGAILDLAGNAFVQDGTYTFTTEPPLNPVNGTSKSDKLTGTAGDDLIVGGTGADKITGGGGADTFLFDNLASGGADKIADFSVAAGDNFAFDATVFTALAGGIDTGNVVIAAKAKALDADDYLLFVSKGGKLYYDADGNGSGTPILLATVKGSLSGIDADCFALG